MVAFLMPVFFVVGTPGSKRLKERSSNENRLQYHLKTRTSGKPFGNHF